MPNYTTLTDAIHNVGRPKASLHFLELRVIGLFTLVHASAQDTLTDEAIRQANCRQPRHFYAWTFAILVCLSSKLIVVFQRVAASPCLGAIGGRDGFSISPLSSTSTFASL